MANSVVTFNCKKIMHGLCMFVIHTVKRYNFHVSEYFCHGDFDTEPRVCPDFSGRLKNCEK